jgi:RNA polymerase sigma-19 factor, ECF subfamily
MAVPTPPTIEHRNSSSPATPAALQLHLSFERNGHDDQRAFDRLFRAYYTRLCAYACSVVKRPDIAEELVADVFVRLWERRTEWQACRNKNGYLYAAVRNQSFKHLEHERIVRSTHELAQRVGRPPGMSQLPAPADEILHTKELAAAFSNAIERLPARCREAYQHRSEGKSYAEIAAIMSTSVRTVETQLARANRALRAVLATFNS